jgi:hypothetical protein
MTMKKPKTMTVYKKFRQRTDDTIIIPQIIIEGIWLADLGFKHGDKFRIEGKAK